MPQSATSAEARIEGRGTGQELPPSQVEQGCIVAARPTPLLVLDVGGGIIRRRLLESPGSHRRPANLGYGLGKEQVDVNAGAVTVVPGSGTTARVASVFADRTDGTLSIAHNEVADVGDAADLASLKHPVASGDDLLLAHIGSQASPIIAATSSITEAFIDNSVRVAG